MENAKNEMRCQIIINFYRKNQAKGKLFTVEFFSKIDVKRDQVYRAIARFESGVSHEQRKGAGRPRKLTKREENKVVKEMENKNGHLPLIDLKKYFFHFHISEG